MLPISSAGCLGDATSPPLAAQENRGCGCDQRSEAARPGPLRATSAATNRALALERGRGWAAADQRGGARGRSPAPRPTCWPQAPVRTQLSLPRPRATPARWRLQIRNLQSPPRPADSTSRVIPARAGAKEHKLLRGPRCSPSPTEGLLLLFCLKKTDSLTSIPFLIIESQTIQMARPYNVHFYASLEPFLCPLSSVGLPGVTKCLPEISRIGIHKQ